MSAESGTTRWWENYLPRYLMPSIAGAAIVNWLCSYGGDELRSLLSLPLHGKPIDAASLTLLFLYGNLFCYIASYPVLVFHATRVMDFPEGKWRAIPLIDGYVTSLILVVVAFLFRFVQPECRYWFAFLAAAVIALVQLGRLFSVFSHRLRITGHGDLVSPAYYYSYVLAHRRGIPAVHESEETTPIDDSAIVDNLSEDKEEEEEEIKTTIRRTNLWRQEFMDTYRHLREHGNSAFIFLLEVALAALAYCIVANPGQTPTHQLGAIGALFAIWATPSIFVHLLSQQLEHRFSRYDQKLRSRQQPTNPSQSSQTTKPSK